MYVNCSKRTTLGILLVKSKSGVGKMEKVSVSLKPLVRRILPTVLKLRSYPERIRKSCLATQVGEIYYLNNGAIGYF